MTRISRIFTPLGILALLVAFMAVTPQARHVLASDYWSIAVSAEAGSEGSNTALEFGTAPGATDGFDSGIDMPSAPPAPGTAFGAYFQITAPLFSELNVDSRGALNTESGASIIWNLEVHSNTQPITVNWSAPAEAGVPLDVPLTLSGGGQTVDMRAVTSATYPAGAYTLVIVAGTGAASPTIPDGDDDAGTDGSQGGAADNTAPPTVAAETVSPSESPEPPAAPDGDTEGNYLRVAPTQALPDQMVTVSANLCFGDEDGGSRSILLTVNGVAEQTKSIEVPAGSCRQVTFTISRATPGTYEVAIDDMTGQFSVLDTETVANTVPSLQPAGLGTTGMIAVIAIILVLILAIIVVFRRL